MNDKKVPSSTESGLTKTITRWRPFKLTNRTARSNRQTMTKNRGHLKFYI